MTRSEYRLERDGVYFRKISISPDITQMIGQGSFGNTKGKVISDIFDQSVATLRTKRILLVIIEIEIKAGA